MLYYCMPSLVTDQARLRRLAMLETVTNPQLKIGARYASPHVIGDRPAELRQILNPGVNLCLRQRPGQPARFAVRLEHDWCGNVMRSKGFFLACLLSDERIAGGPAVWKTLDDPFPRWFAEKNED